MKWGEIGDKEMSMKTLETPTGSKERVPNLSRQALSEESDDTRGWARDAEMVVNSRANA